MPSRLYLILKISLPPCTAGSKTCAAGIPPPIVVAGLALPYIGRGIASISMPMCRQRTLHRQPKRRGLALHGEDARDSLWTGPPRSVAVVSA
jgi:hypothetical protein